MPSSIAKAAVVWRSAHGLRKPCPAARKLWSRYGISDRASLPSIFRRLTERFYRVDVASSRDKGGTGLGLAIVKHILNRHRGRLTIESRPGEGATFLARLAAARSRGENIIH